MRDHHPVIPRLTVEQLSGPAELAEIAGEWELLDRETLPRTPFTSPAYLVPWWKHFSARRNVLLRHEFFVHTVRDGSGRLLALAPLMRTVTPSIGPPALRLLQFFGNDPALTEIRGVICQPGQHLPVVQALVRHFLGCGDEWDVFRWAGLRYDADTYMQSHCRCFFRSRKNLPDYILDLPGSWEELRLRVSSNMRKNLRKPYELLERGGFITGIRVTERPDGVAPAMERFLALHSARAEAADMISHPHKFGQQHIRAFLSDYLHCLAKRGELRIFELEIGGSAVASRLAFRLGSDLYLYFAGYDPAWKDYSVMTVLMAEIVKWAIAHGIERVNLSTGHDQSKVRWKPREVLFSDAVLVSPTQRARMAFRALQAYETLRKREV